MEEVKLTVEAVTPLFMGGVNQELDAFRIPSLRGVLRFWFRALMGGVIGNVAHNVDALRQVESTLFGNTERASSVQFRLGSSPTCGSIFGKDLKDSSIRYLSFSLANRRAVQPGCKFDLLVSLRPGARNATDALNLALGAFWLLVQLGGLGARSRRGFGSIRLTNMSPKPQALPSFGSTVSSPEEMKQLLSNGLQQLHKLSRRYLDTTLGVSGSQAFGKVWTEKDLPEYDILGRRVARIRVSNMQVGSWCEVLQQLGQELRNYRRSLPLPERVIFGLPIRNLRDDRRASPLMFKVIRYAGGNYGAVMTLFKTKFLADDGETESRYRAIDRFMNKMSGYEVELPW